ncbi:DUF3810 family protein [Candidatus Uabimicrobium sp. HlEnr_7]|uniref:DUF3810 family protein n=1 Tax=Candidatus Uabimicrobium helgolandensis TaxID=3095367 RepID=UPI0035586F7F
MSLSKKLPIAIAILIFLLRLATVNFPQLVDTWYSCLLYPYSQFFLSLIAKLFFFCSIDELFLLVILCTSVILCWKSYKCKNRKQFLQYLGINTIIAFCYIYCVFNLVWGFNYLRQPFHQHMKIEITTTSIDNYEKVAQKMVTILNELQDCQFLETELPDNKVNIAIHKTITSIYPNPVTPPPTKYLFFNEFMNIAGISGIFLPLFMEPHINADLLPWERPLVMAHEKAHFHGFASETDANLVAYIACISASQGTLRYSAALRIFISFSNYLPIDKWKQLAQQLNETTREDIKRWQQRLQRNRQHYGFFNKLSSQVNNAYLKLNSQQLGILAYSAALPQFVLWWQQYKK